MNPMPIEQFDELYARYYPNAILYCQMLGLCLAHAKFATDHMFTLLINKPFRFVEDDTFREWLFFTLRRCAKSRSPVVLSILLTGSISKELASPGTLDLNEEESFLFEHIKSLPKMWREAIYLTVMERFSPETAARIAGVAASEITEWTASGLTELDCLLKSKSMGGSCAEIQ